jgi:hypothetical protein
MDSVRELSGWIMSLCALAILAVRFFTRSTPAKKRRVATIISVPWGGAGIIYTWLQPQVGQGPNVPHIIVYVSLGIGLLTLVDHAVDWRRARVRLRSGVAE